MYEYFFEASLDYSMSNKILDPQKGPSRCIHVASRSTHSFPAVRLRNEEYILQPGLKHFGLTYCPKGWLLAFC